MRMLHTVIYDLSGSTMLFDIISETAPLSKTKNLYLTQNVCFDFLYNFYLKYFSFKEEFGEILS